jgi:hypothetical protein
VEVEVVAAIDGGDIRSDRAQQSRGDSCLQHGAAVDGDEAAANRIVVVPERIGVSPDR